MSRLRIDAGLHTVEPVYSDDLRCAEAAFSDGMFDCSPLADEAARRLVRARSLEVVLFNDALNRAMAAYGVHVVNVPSTEREWAVQYGGGGYDPLNPDLPVSRAREVRSYVLPAVAAVYRPDLRATWNVLGEMFDDMLRCVVPA